MSDTGGYIDPPIEYRGDVLTQLALQRLMELNPGWVPMEAHLETRVISILARLVGEARVVASAVPRSIFRDYGRSVIQLPPIEAQPARAASTWTMVDAAGYTINEGTLVGLRRTGDVVVPFRVEYSVTVPVGQTATQPGEVQLVALDAGEEANGIPAGTAVLIEPLAYVEYPGGVVTTEATAGGVSAESTEQYLNRLVDEMTIVAATPILPNDFAILARRVSGVHRSLAIDGYNPIDDTFNNERMVTVAVVDEDGADLPSGIKDAVKALLEGMREVNFVVHVIGPTYTPIDVDAEVVSDGTVDDATLQADVDAALNEYLASGSWGGGTADPPRWLPSATVVRYLEVAEAINRVPGVDYIESLTINADGEAPGTANVMLDGVAPLTVPGAITVTVAA